MQLQTFTGHRVQHKANIALSFTYKTMIRGSEKTPVRNREYYRNIDRRSEDNSKQAGESMLKYFA